MATGKKALVIAKFTGVPKDISLDKWLQLFEKRKNTASWTERNIIGHFSASLTVEHCAGTSPRFLDIKDELREKIKNGMLECFPSFVADWF